MRYVAQGLYYKQWLLPPLLYNQNFTLYYLRTDHKPIM